MNVTFVVYPLRRSTLAGPYEVISLAGAEVHFVASSPAPVRCDSGLDLGGPWRSGT